MMGKGKHSRRFLFQKTIITSVIPLASRIAAQDIDYTCYPQNDFGASPSCQYVANGVCDDPNHGGFGGEGCRNQDCIDCNYQCKLTFTKSNRQSNTCTKYSRVNFPLSTFPLPSFRIYSKPVAHLHVESSNTRENISF